MTDSPQPETPPSDRPVAVFDSPWLWFGIFGIGAILALFLTMPKFSWRQPQIERQFQARERAGQAISATGGPREISRDGHSMITLRPLVYLLASLIFLASCVFWLRRFFRTRLRNGNDSPTA
jgi:hypothetical protein